MKQVDSRYQPILDGLVSRFVEHLGPRLKSAFVKGSIARGDAIWGVSDIDFVLAFDDPTPADTALKQEREATASETLGEDILIVMRISEDRLQQMDEGTRAYWLYSCRHEIEILYGANPDSFLPQPPYGQELARLIAPIMRKDGDALLDKPRLNRRETRLIAKRMFHILALNKVIECEKVYIAPFDVPTFNFSPDIRRLLPTIVSAFMEAPETDDPRLLYDAWQTVWAHVGQTFST